MNKKITYEDVANNPASEVKLRCKKTHKGSYNVGIGQIGFYSYEEGEILPRTKIILVEENWELC